jgi:tetratricopeptide (TPR) repeat protein
VNSTVIIGIPAEKVEELVREATRPWEQLSDAKQQIIKQLEEKLDLNRRQIMAMLTILGEADVPPEHLTEKLLEVAHQLKRLREVVGKPSDDPELVRMRTDVAQAVNDGELGKADSILAEIEKREVQTAEGLALTRAQTSANRGAIALAQLRYLDAATMFGKAVTYVPNDEKYHQLRRVYLLAEASALSRQGREFGSLVALQLAIDRFRRAADLTPRDRLPIEWSAIQADLARATSEVGKRTGEIHSLEQSAEIYRGAANAQLQKLAPLDWAIMQSDLAAVLSVLGERTNSTARLKEAVVAHRAALSILSRKQAPRPWADSQNNLGNALARLAAQDHNPKLLKEAAAAYRAALLEANKDVVDQAMTLSNLGNVLRMLGADDPDGDYFEQAAIAFRTALADFPRHRLPLQWAMLQNNLGVALWSRGQRGGVKYFQQAVEAHRAALMEYTRERDGLMWARSQANLSQALLQLGQLTTNPEYLDEGVTAVRGALTELTPDRVPLDWWARTQRILANSLHLLGVMRNDIPTLEAAVQAYKAALNVRTQPGGPRDWGPKEQAVAQENLGAALLQLGARKYDLTLLEESVNAYKVALTAFHAMKLAEHAARAQSELRKIESLLELGRRALKKQ